jgi:hypothetical protein
MSTDNDSTMGTSRRRMGVGMEPVVGTEMDPLQADLHTLDPEEQRVSMGVAKPRSAMGQPPEEGLPSPDEIARREEAAKRGENL